MHPRLLFPLICCLLVSVATKALAAPIAIPASLAASGPRSDAANGICTTTVHVSMDNVLSSPAVAEALLDSPALNPPADDKVVFPYSLVNFHNSFPGANTDYSTPAPEPLPFTTLTGSPHGTNLSSSNEKNIAMRVRGYVNIERAGTYTFAVLADDGFTLYIAGTQILQSTTTGISLRDSRQVSFAAAGLYAVDLVYFKENQGTAILDLAVSDRADAEVVNYPQPLGADFQLLGAPGNQNALYSAVAGASNCTECTDDATCGTGQGRYCRDGLCQSCIVDNHCGAACVTCPGATPVCSAGACVQCSATEHSVCDRLGQLCENGQCVACVADVQCGAGKICDLDFGQCIPTPPLTPAGGCSATQAPGGRAVPAMLLLLGLLMMGVLLRGRGNFRRAAPVDPIRPAPRRGAKRSGVTGASRIATLLPLSLLSLLCGSARAQSASATPVLQFNAQTYRPAIGPGNVFTVEGTLMPKALWPLGGVVFDYANQPLRLNSTGGVFATPVPFMLTAHLMPGVGLTRWLSVGLDVPLVIYQGFDNRTPTSIVPTTPTAFGVGDLRLVAKLRILNNESGGLGLAVVPQFTFPTGSATSFRGEGTLGIEPRLALDYRFQKGAFVALNASYYLRTYNRDVDFGLTQVSDEIRYGLGTAIPLVKGLGVSAEINGAVGVSSLQGGSRYAPLEVLAGLHYRMPSNVEIGVGGGGALVSAVGTPNFRLLASVGYAIPGKKGAAGSSGRGDEDDPDGDGLTGSADECPNLPGPKANNGCPDKDSDGDGVVDRLDRCPTRQGTEANHGCPEGALLTATDKGPAQDKDKDKDSDGDGVPDRLDKCPDQPGTADNSGCPATSVASVLASDGDRDKDGVLDKDDKCPDQAGPAENGGCPDADADGDGIVDRLDKCPSQAGPKDNDGCPPFAITSEGVTLGRPIKFRAHRRDLEDSSNPVVMQLAKAMLDDPSVKKIIISVTAPGDKRSAKALAGNRAKVLIAAFVDLGVSKKRLQIKPAKVPGGDEIVQIGVKMGKGKHVRVKKGHVKKEHVKKAKGGKKHGKHKGKHGKHKGDE